MVDGVGGNRLEWQAVPVGVRAVVEAALGSGVVRAVNQRGGFSPGLAARVRLADGRGVFVKAAGRALNPVTTDLHRREAYVAARLPATVPAPRLLWWHDDGDWVVLVFEEVAGHQPTLPWQRADWHRVHAALVGLAEVLTPSPVEANPINADGDDFSGWRSLAADPALAARLDPWSRANLDRLAELERRWPAAAAGETLLHGDPRADNLLLTAEGVVFVDWPQAAVGARWVDLLCMLPSVAMQGGPDPAETWRTSPLARGADPDAVNAVLAAVTGYFAHSALLPAPRGLPRLRDFQRAQASPALAWLRSRL
ncbi:phosphotransferase [Actinokineospora sp. NBRC 105648]|uniref:phosphotransferase family protein n=1 Tax=Actinokineospora sp. NBRC 105648 TaxID=3032206 RepID=UPI0024A2D554|nr:phosphotransferase [Actinokineospora sp. NBRC 105648]GLZ43136.1 hypothetical protein Acsp05_67600 [Actinokineospora sp. NBRC 105648]